MKHINRKILLLLGLAGIVAAACTKKPEEGFLGNKFFYLSNPFIGTKGRVVTSVPLQTDGSTYPITVKLLAVRNAAGQTIDSLGKQYEIPIYKGEILATDTTLAQLATKLGTAQYAAFNVNSNGGRLELTPASAMVNAGTYDFDIEVSNMRGSKVINSVAKVQLTPSVPFQLIRQFANTSAPNQELTFTTQNNFSVTVERKDGPNKVIVRFLDKNGVPFNPKTGQVIPRASLANSPRFEFRQFDLYYAEEKTDTALVYTYPEKTPTFPLYMLNNAFLSSYRIPNNYNDLNVNINPEFAVRLFPSDGVPYVSGTWTITNRINFAAKL